MGEAGCLGAQLPQLLSKAPDSTAFDLQAARAVPRGAGQGLVSKERYHTLPDTVAYYYLLTYRLLTKVWSDHMPLAIVVHGGT